MTTLTKNRLLLPGISIGYFMVLLDLTVLSIAEPDLARSLHTSVAGLQWATTGYTLVFGALLLSGGAVADRYGADRAFRSAIAVFGIGSLLCAAAPGLWVLVSLRGLIGAAAAACVPASMALVARLYPEPAARAKAVAAWAAISGSAVAAGPIAGGALVELAGWRAIFVVNAPIAVLVLALTASKELRAPRGTTRIDWPAQLLACVVLALLTDAVISARLGSGVACCAAAVLFLLRERRSSSPVVNRVLAGSAEVRAGLAAGAAVNFALTGDLFVPPLLLQDGRGLGPVRTGLAFLPLTLPFVLNPPFTGRVVARYGARPAVLAGMGLLASGGAVLGIAVAAGTAYRWLAVGLLLTGFGVSFALPALVTAVITAAPEGTAGAAGGVLNAVRQTGATLGVAVMGAIGSAGYARALVVPAVVCGAAGLWFAVRTAGRRRP